MAGIGFELKRLFKKKGFLAIIKAYGYAGLVCTGPMILGVFLILIIRIIGAYAGMGEGSLEALTCMLTVTFLVSIIATSGICMLATRYVADQLFEEKYERIIPSFFGSMSISLVVGSIAYGIFLLNAEVKAVYAIECYVLFAFLIVVWSEMNYLTAIKDFMGMVKGFAVSITVGLFTSFVLSFFAKDLIAAMFFGVCLSYGIMAVWFYKLLISFFPVGMCSAMDFLRWFDKYPQLFFVGTFSSIGLIGHIMLMWTGPASTQVIGKFYAAPIYDIAAILAFISTLVTTINFVTSVEVNFYPKYRNYFALFNDGGSFADIKQAEKEMMDVLKQELTYTFTKQFFVTIVFIIGGTMLFPMLPLGMTEDILGIFRVLCIGYAFYAMGNCLMLIQLYFSYNTGAFWATLGFMVVSVVGTIHTMKMDITYYGLGFMLGGAVLFLIAYFLLVLYLNKILYKVLCNQPVVASVRKGLLSEISGRFWNHYQEKYNIIPPELQEIEEEE